MTRTRTSSSRSRSARRWRTRGAPTSSSPFTSMPAGTKGGGILHLRPLPRSVEPGGPRTGRTRERRADPQVPGGQVHHRRHVHRGAQERVAAAGQTVNDAVVRHVSTRYPGVHTLGLKQAPFYVLVGARMTAVLVEASFISNAREESRLRDPSCLDGSPTAWWRRSATTGRTGSSPTRITECLFHRITGPPADRPPRPGFPRPAEGVPRGDPPRGARGAAAMPGRRGRGVPQDLRRDGRRPVGSPRPGPRAIPRLGARHVLPNGGCRGGRLRAARAVPHSDVDLLFLHGYKVDRFIEAMTEWMLYPLWDLGLEVGHSVRNIKETIRLAGADDSIRTALLDHRLVAGDDSLYRESARELDRFLYFQGGDKFIGRRSRRCARGTPRSAPRSTCWSRTLRRGAGAARSADGGLGGADQVQVRGSVELRKKGVRGAPTVEALRHVLDYLLRVRNELHYLQGKKADVLGFEVQERLRSGSGIGLSGRTRPSNGSCGRTTSTRPPRPGSPTRSSRRWGDSCRRRGAGSRSSS